MNDGIKKMMNEINQMKDIRKNNDELDKHYGLKSFRVSESVENSLKEFSDKLTKCKNDFRREVASDGNECRNNYFLNLLKSDLNLIDKDKRDKAVSSILKKVNDGEDVIKQKDVYTLVYDFMEDCFLDRKPVKDNPASLYDRDLIITTVSKKLLTGEYSQGDALKKLRVNVLNLDQERFAKLVGVSRKTVSDVENNKGNYTVNVLNSVFKPFGLQVSITPTKREKLKQLL